MVPGVTPTTLRYRGTTATSNNVSSHAANEQKTSPLMLYQFVFPHPSIVSTGDASENIIPLGECVFVLLYLIKSEVISDEVCHVSV